MKWDSRINDKSCCPGRSLVCWIYINELQKHKHVIPYYNQNILQSNWELVPATQLLHNLIVPCSWFQIPGTEFDEENIYDTDITTNSSKIMPRATNLCSVWTLVLEQKGSHHHMKNGWVKSYVLALLSFSNLNSIQMNTINGEYPIQQTKSGHVTFLNL